MSLDNLWQKCPACEGTGLVPPIHLMNTVEVCSTCNGKKIINILTGLPPTENNAINNLWINGKKRM